jgi:O-succinylbenzoic acid--CoA ligase
MLYLLPDLPQAAKDFLALWEDPRQNEFVFQTSGTTGPSRSHRLSREQMIQAALSSQEALGWSPGQRVGMVLPATGMGGKMSLVRASVFGMISVPLALDLRPQPWTQKPGDNTTPPRPYDAYLDHLSLVPSQALALLRHWLDLGVDPGDRLGTLLLGGGPAVTDLRKVLERAPANGKPWRVFLGFGMTETAGHFALQQLFPHPQASYKPLPGLQISLEPLNSTSNDPNDINVGALVVTGPVTNHQPLSTREIAKLNPAEGTFDWLGRADLTIQSGGHTLLIDDLEAQIRFSAAQNPDLAWLKGPHWYLAPLPDPVWGEQVALCLPQSMLGTLPKDPLYPHTWAPCLPKSAYPRYLVIVPEDCFEVPGKVRRLGAEALALLNPKPLTGGYRFVGKL